MWAKKIAAGVLAAALSLTLLSGCSGGRSGSGSVISEGETISFDTSASYRLVQYTGNIYLTYELECTNEKDGTKIYAGQANKARCFAGTHEAITMDVKADTTNYGMGVMAGIAGGRMIPAFSRCRICPWHYFGIKSLWATIFVRSRK